MQNDKKFTFKKLNIQKESYHTKQIKEQEKRIILYFNLTQNCELLTKLPTFKFLFQSENFFLIELENEQIFKEKEKQIGDIDLSTLTKIKIKLLNFAKKVKTCQFKVVLQYHDIQMKEQSQIERHIYQLFDGLLTQLQYAIVLTINEEQDQITAYQLTPLQDQITAYQLTHSQEKLQNNLVNKKVCDQQEIELDPLYGIDIQFKNLLKQDTGFFQFEYNDYCSIGLECYFYIRDELHVLSQLILKNIRLFQLNIYELLELPINLQVKNNQNENVKQFLKLLKSLIIRFLQIFNENKQCAQSYLEKIHYAIIYWEPRILYHLKCLNLKNATINSYIEKEKIFLYDYKEIIDEYKSKQEIYQDNTEAILIDLLEKDLKTIELQNAFEVKYFDIHLPSRLKLFQEINNFSIQQKHIDKTNVCLLGLTKTGKSTFLNILINPENMKIIQNEQQYQFSIIKSQDDIRISKTNKSETKQTQDVEIGNFIFTDTPGFIDTESQNRLINQVKIFTQLQRSKQIIFLILIDGQRLCENINDLYSTIEHIYLFFGNKLIEQFIIPVFNKLELNTMEEIKKLLKQDIENDKTSNEKYCFLEAIKKSIDNNGHIEIYKASYYLKENDIKDLKQQQKEIQDKITQLIRDNKDYQEIKELNDQVLKLQTQIDIKSNQQQQQINYDLLDKIRQQILKKCEQLQNEQIQTQFKIEFNLSLNAEMKEHYDSIVKHEDEICKCLLEQITYVIINNLINDHQRNIDDVKQKCELIQQIIQDFKSIDKKITVYKFFDSLRQEFSNQFQTQILISEKINKLSSFDNLSQFIPKEQKKKETHDKYLKENLGIDYIESELELVKQICTNLHNNQNFRDLLEKQRFKRFKVYFFRLILPERAERIQQTILKEQERLKMEILKIEYKEKKKSQVAQ